MDPGARAQNQTIESRQLIKITSVLELLSYEYCCTTTRIHAYMPKGSDTGGPEFHRKAPTITIHGTANYRFGTQNKEKPPRHVPCNLFHAHHVEAVTAAAAADRCRCRNKFATQKNVFANYYQVYDQAEVGGPCLQFQVWLYRVLSCGQPIPPKKETT